MSLRQRLVLLFFVGTLLVWVPVNFFLYKGALAEVDELWDSHLAQSARVLLAFAAASAEQKDLRQVQALLPRLVPADLPEIHRRHLRDGPPRRLFAFQLVTGDGSFRLDSPDAPAELFADGIAGFSYRVIDGTAWRVFGIADPSHQLILYVGEDHAVRKDLAWHLVEHLVFPSLLAIPPLLLLIWFAVDQGLKPLVVLVREVKQRAPRDLHPLETDTLPIEIAPLAAALNSLFIRLERALESERQFTGNAAHELRTPLAALRVQAQVAQRAVSDKQRQRALRQVLVGVDQSSHLLEQLLTLARLDRRDATPFTRSVNLLEIARRAAASLEPLARESGVVVQVRGEEDTLSSGDDTCFLTLMRNLIDNAIRYTSSGGMVTITLDKGSSFNRLTIDDTGPGIADAEQDDMFRRFRRGSQTDRPGSGLGLSIVRRICESYGCCVRLENRPEGGLRCEVRLPNAAALEPFWVQKTDAASITPSPGC